jgi:hypothetical protein
MKMKMEKIFTNTNSIKLQILGGGSAPYSSGFNRRQWGREAPVSGGLQSVRKRIINTSPTLLTD